MFNSLKDKPGFLKDFSITFIELFTKLIDDELLDVKSFTKQLPFLKESGLLEALKTSVEGQELLTKLVSAIKKNSNLEEYDTELLGQYGISVSDSVGDEPQAGQFSTETPISEATIIEAPALPPSLEEQALPLSSEVL